MVDEPIRPPLDDDLDPTLGIPEASAGTLGTVDTRANAESAAATPLERVGPYRILKRIGSGGMGEVFLAEQTQPIRREVALKIIRPGMDSRDVVARFEAERQALALMNHPHIARVFDAGATPQGQPYFAMEYVDGFPITEFCDRERLGLRERLEIFIGVCDGVQHAHQKAIIHRDLKPSNILVTPGTPPRPKIIDFGIAKATAQPLTETTMFTAVGQIIGTPDYMSPEQAAMTTDDIDTRADIYSLGVVLYELLVGARPFDASEFHKAGFEGMLRQIREVEPPRPSTRLTALAADTGFAARNRGTETARLRGALRGDLDWITMKALEKDRARRYETANGLAMDIQRYLDNESVLASPPSATYRLQKMARRHRAAFIALAAVVVVLAAATVVSTSLFVRATRESERARTEAARATQTANFMTQMLAGVGPSVAMGRDTQMLREILDQSNQRVGAALAGQPEVEAEMRAVLSNTYLDLGEIDAAEKQAQRAVAILRSARGDHDSTTLAAQARLGVVASRLGRLAEAESLLSHVGAQQSDLFGDDDRELLVTRGALAEVYAYQGRSAEAESLGRLNVPQMRGMFGDDDPRTQQAIYHLAVAYSDNGKLAESESLYAALIAIHDRNFGPDYPGGLAAKASLGWLYQQEGRSVDAERLTRGALEAMRRVLGNDHPSTLMAVNNLAIVYKKMGRFSDAEPLYIEGVETSRRVMGEKHPETVTGMVNLASFYLAEGRLREAEDVATRSIEIFDEVMPPEYFVKAVARRVRGESRARRGVLAGAEADLLAAYPIYVSQAGESSTRANEIRALLADVYAQMGRRDEAARWQPASDVTD